MSKYLVAILLFILTSVSVFSQDFIYHANLPTVDSSGYYHIFLPPNVTSKLNHKFSDLRIFDKNENEVPYIRLSEDEMYKTAKSYEIKILQNDYKRTKKHSFLLIHNDKLLSINNFVLEVDNPQNAEAWLNIAGSNDLKNWNILKNNSRYMPEYSDSATAQIRINDLPESNFEYYRLMIFDFNKVIFNVKKVLNFDIAETNVEFVEVQKPTFIQDDTSESNLTIVQITFTEPQYIDKIWFEITEPKNYLRKAEITKKDSTTGKRIRLQFYDQNQRDFYLCSDSTNELLLSRYYAKNMFLIVSNNDDSPLKFSDITAYQQKEYIVAYLETAKEYEILFGNKNIPAPIYDLKFFKNKIPAKCPVVQIQDAVLISDNANNAKIVSIKPVFLWIIFFVVIALLAGISIKMFLFSKKENNNKVELL